MKLNNLRFLPLLLFGLFASFSNSGLALADFYQRCPSIEGIGDSFDDKLLKRDGFWELKTDNGIIVLEENQNQCSFFLYSRYSGAGSIAGLNFVNAFNKANQFGFLTRHKDDLILENFILLPDTPTHVLKLHVLVFINRVGEVNKLLRARLASRLNYFSKQNGL